MKAEYTEAQIDELLEDYYIPCDDGDYNPTEHERFLIKNFMMGLPDDLLALKDAPPGDGLRDALEEIALLKFYEGANVNSAKSIALAALSPKKKAVKI